jgi:hypothetical protein
MNMRKHLMTGLVFLAASYSVTALALGSGSSGLGSGSSGGRGTDNFMLTLTGQNPGVAGDGPGGFAATMSRIFYGGAELHFDVNGLLVNGDGNPFTGKTYSGDTYKDGKKI